jgi:cytochrome c556
MIAHPGVIDEGMVFLNIYSREVSMNRTLATSVLVVVLCFGFALAALAQQKPEVLVKQRQAAMTLQAKYFGPLGAMAQGKASYDGKIVERNAEYLSVLTKIPWDGFTPSTANEKSGALPAVYSDTAKFNQAADDLQAAAAKLAAVSKGKDEAAVKAAIGAMGKACGSCHDGFRQKP